MGTRKKIRRRIETKLADLARAVLDKYQPRVIAITGSVGKSSAKEALRAVLSPHFKLRASKLNYNTEFGVPLIILGERSPGKSLFGWWRLFNRAKRLARGGATDYPEVLVLEMGSDKPGDIEKLVKIVRPDVAIVTDVSGSHLHNFKTLKMVAQEKSVLVRALKSEGLAVLNADNELVREMRDVAPGRVLLYGFNEQAEVKGLNIKPSKSIAFTKEMDPEMDLLARDGLAFGTAFALTHKGESVTVNLPRVLGKQNAYAALAAAAVGIDWGLALDKIAQALLDFVPAPGRMNLIAGIKQTLIIDDTYNASPISALAALDALDQLSTPGRKIAILGDMAELGPDTEAGHARVGERVAKVADFVIFVGQKMKFAAGTALQSGLSDEKQTWVADAKQVEAVIQSVLQPQDVVLVKGSRNMKMEQVVKALMATPLRAPQLLVTN